MDDIPIGTCVNITQEGCGYSSYFEFFNTYDLPGKENFIPGAWLPTGGPYKVIAKGMHLRCARMMYVIEARSGQVYITDNEEGTMEVISGPITPDEFYSELFD